MRRWCFANCCENNLPTYIVNQLNLAQLPPPPWDNPDYSIVGCYLYPGSNACAGPNLEDYPFFIPTDLSDIAPSPIIPPYQTTYDIDGCVLYPGSNTCSGTYDYSGKGNRWTMAEGALEVLDFIQVVTGETVKVPPVLDFGVSFGQEYEDAIEQGLPTSVAIGRGTIAGMESNFIGWVAVGTGGSICATSTPVGCVFIGIPTYVLLGNLAENISQTANEKIIYPITDPVFMDVGTFIEELYRNYGRPQ